MLMSMKSRPPLLTTSSSSSCTHLDMLSEYPPHTCAPKMSSLGCLRSSAHSAGWPWSRFVTMAISPQVMSTPYRLQMRRNGRLPVVVKGAR